MVGLSHRSTPTTNQQPLTTDFMFEKLEAIERTYEELTQQMTDPAVIGDQARYTKVAKQSRELSRLSSSAS